jgi:hypothetical protein
MENSALATGYIKKKIGIQKGVCATDSLARSLDDGCKNNVQGVLTELQSIYGNKITFKKKLDKGEIPGGVGACQPDGGLWYFKGQLIAAFEAKKQGEGGNAIERWFKNNFICRLISPSVSYVTFAAGPGAKERGVIEKTLSVAHLRGFNKFVPGENSLFLSEAGFTPNEIKAIMIQAITSAILNHEN